MTPTTPVDDAIGFCVEDPFGRLFGLSTSLAGGGEKAGVVDCAGPRSAELLPLHEAKAVAPIIANTRSMVILY